MLVTDSQLKCQFSSAKKDWETPQDLFDQLDKQYHFTLDAASSDENAKCRKHFTKRDDSLTQNWGGHTVWLNPPYGRQIGRWVQKAFQESQKPNTTVVCLLPARTDTAWFHDYCVHGRISFIRGRVRFSGCDHNAPFPSMVVVFDGKCPCDALQCATIAFN